MTGVAARARDRGVTEIRHYTSERGVMGSIMRGRLLSRDRVEDDADLAFIFEGVWERRDPDWTDHISLSVSRINIDLYQRSRRHFPDYWWAVMAFDVEVLDDSSVVFTTTNNVYDEVCRRAPGLDGFEDMFAERVPWGYRGSVKLRPARCPTTCRPTAQPRSCSPGRSPWTASKRCTCPAGSTSGWSTRGARFTAAPSCRSSSIPLHSPNNGVAVPRPG